ncbi:late embryogenesis abundant protein At1g64065-like [Vitis vinifera]|uniref:late embryogenesis abundant protein At1g64065-like n=1 Tax=Vitis vinifera TaxID=29760 RepID=UPI0008FED268|nr:late embryogenesis abundant protein At1g64065-like [Vitis vinifera]|eukprot:XP_010662660.2 PREDICTED: late embryogenesis abundant protein At1g64065-like [Vitis vinifera]
MAQKKQQVHPIEPTGGPAKTDVESEELRRMKCTRYIAYLSAFALFETIVIMVCVVTLMRIRSPKFRFRAVSIENLNYTSDTTSPSFNIRFNAKVAVKNTNFGHFKFKNSTITLAYRGDHVGDAKISKARARARSTKKMNVTVDVNSDHVWSHSNLARDLNSGFLTLTSQGKLSGKVHLMKELVKYDLDIDIFTKKKKKQQAAQEEAASSHALGFKQLVKCGLDIDIFTKKKKKK